MMQIKQKGKKYVNVLSTIYNDSVLEVTVGGKQVTKLKVCIKYKKHHMAGVDIMEQIISVQASA